MPGGGSPAPTPNGAIAASAVRQAQLGEEWLNFSKEQFAVSQTRLSEIDALAKSTAAAQLKLAQDQSAYTRTQTDKQMALAEEQLGINRGIAAKQMESAEWQDGIAREDRQRYEDVYRPIEDQYIEEASNYGSADRQAEAAGAAMADVRSAAAASRAGAQREAASLGINPNSGRWAGIDRAGELGTSLAVAGAGNNARTQVRDKGLSLKADLANLGRGVSSQALQTAQSATGTQNSALTASNTGAGMVLANSNAAIANRGTAASGESNAVATGLAGSLNANSQFLGSTGIVGQGYSGASSGYAQQANKRFIHRKGISGFDGDALRTFASNQFHAAHQMARLKFGLELLELANQAVDQARKADDPVRGMVLANELKKRHEWVMNPTGSRTVQAVTSAMFVWYLAATPAAALVNATQTPMMGIPVLGSRLGGMRKAAVAIAKASADVVRGKGTAMKSALTADERRAMEKFYESGMIDRTQAHDLAGVGEVGVAYSPLRHKVMSVISWAYHNVEVWNREVTALAAYRMAREQGQHESKAIDTAHELTWAAHFDYSNSSRARVMQGDAAKVLFVFQSHQVNMWFRLFRDIHQSVKGESPQARKEARYQLAGILGMMTLFSGVTGFFGYNVLITLLGMVFDDDDDPRSFKAEMEGHVVDLLGPDLGGMVLKGVPGHLTGIDLTSRIGMPDFFVRGPDNGSEGRDWFQDFLIGAMGVVPSTMINTFDGISLALSGDVVRGLEVMAPKSVKDLMQAYRYANEGVLSRKGDVVLERDRLDAWDVIAEAVGFTPAKVAETYERIGALKDAEQYVLDERRELMNRFAMAFFAEDDEAKSRAIAAITAWNKKPYAKAVPITGKGLEQSLKARQRNAIKREDGALISDPELAHLLRKAMPERMY